jgi:translation initiation factor IF-2
VRLQILNSDVERAIGTHAIIIGFNTVVRPSAAKMAETGHVLIRTYNIIYELLDEVKDVVEGMLQVGQLEEVLGRAQIIAEFPYGKEDKIAGCKILDGTFSKGPKVRLVRGEEIVGEGKIKSLKMAREEVNRVEKGQECGMMFDKLEFAIGDVVESFRVL